MNTSFAYQTLALSFLVPAAVFAQSNTTIGNLPSFSWEKLSRYVETDFFYTHDFVSNTGGEKAGLRNIGAIDLYLRSDLSKFSRVNGETMIHYTHINQNDDRAAIGDTQGASNIDMPGQVDRLTDVYYQHNFSDNFNALAGLHDISAEFYVTESSLNFMNGGFGTGTELAASGLNGPTLYPITSVGTRAFYQVTEDVSVRTGIYDGNPGDESTYRKMGSGIGGSEGYFIITEVTLNTSEERLAFGGWNYTDAVAKISDENEKATAYGMYGTFERELQTNLWTFARVGWASPVVTPVHNNIATGIVYRGIFQTKKNQDEVGLGMARANLSDTIQNETAYEGYYHFKLVKILTLRPDVQYIKNPSGAVEVKDAWAFGLRTVVEL